VPVGPSDPTPIPRTCLDVISSALRLIGVLASGETADPATANDSLNTFQDMIDSWQAERLMIFQIPRIIFDLVSGQQTYLYGSQVATNPIIPDFNSPRPARIDRVGIIWLGNAAQPLELPMQYLTVAQWQEIPVKNITSSLPQYVWDDNGFPFRALNFWPTPNVADQVVIYPWTALTTPALLTTQLAFPPGYAKAIRYNLAVDLAAEFPVVPANVLGPVQQIAIESKAVVKSINAPIIDLFCDPGVTQQNSQSYQYNWISDMPAGR
jgi:hypothetical protein